MNSETIGIAYKLLEDPMKALVVGSAVISWFLIKKNSRLFDETLEAFKDHKKDLRESTNKVKDEFYKLQNEINEIKKELNILSDKVFDSHTRYVNDFEKTYKELNKVYKIEADIKETYGKILEFSEDQKSGNIKLQEIRQDVENFKKIIRTHNDILKKQK